jgi:amino acid adenylation domain-containing protein
MTSLLQEYGTRQAHVRPDATALVMDGEHVSYGQLEAWTNQLGRLINAVGCRKGDRVCLLLPKAPSTIIGMIAALKAGCAYVPIDVASPAARIEKIVRSAAPSLVLVTETTRALVEELYALHALGRSVAVGSIDDELLEGANFRCQFSRRDWQGFAPDPLDSVSATEDPAHVLFTSGSTGTPKGVVITHASAIAFIEWAVGYFGTTSSDRISGHPPLHFDLSTFDIYGALSAGAELHLVPPGTNLVPAKLAELIRKSELTQWFSVPSTMTYMAKFDVFAYDDFPSLKRVLWCGEVLPTPILIHWMKRLPRVRFTNLYGPTEATIASSYYTLPDCPVHETDPIPIGTACPGEELLLLDGVLQPVRPSVKGDLYIAGIGLSPGYWRDEEKTRAAFLPDPRSSDPGARIYKTGDLARIDDDGLVYFLGRADSQIKSRGYRIELGEIEAALSAMERVRECAVVGVESDGFEGVAICCAYAPVAGANIDPTEVRQKLREMLPSYMLPTRWMALEELPKNVNEKIDRRRLREIFEDMSRSASEDRDQTESRDFMRPAQR